MHSFVSTSYGRRLASTPALIPHPALSSPEQFDQVLARVLDRQADMALQQGYRLQAERLAHRAAELREGAC